MDVLFLNAEERYTSVICKPMWLDKVKIKLHDHQELLGINLVENTWSLNTSSISKKSQQGLYFLWRQRKAHLPPPILTMFYRGTIESVLGSCITASNVMQQQRYYLLAGKLSRSEQLTGIDEKQAEQKKSGAKRKKSVDETEEEDARPSSVSSSSQKKPMIILDDSSEEFEELSEKEDRNQAEEEEKETDESSEDIEDLSETEDMSKFEAADLPVSCGSVTGVLHKRRFAGPHSKSIRTKKCWFTPVEFAKQAFTQTDGHWKKDILCHGKTLEYLVKMKILDFHPQGCRCQVCCPKSPEERYSSVISKPMWMDKVKLKLKKNKYTTVGEFVQDINLIFDNYQTFYKDNAGKMGDKMKKIFEKMFDTVFKIQ
ncbi:hypothetical protein QTP86_006484 [Hemibagrus guttatus]|nr:hypothetical protein QTP86_006484 [Hemibagrus guttatus]